MFTFSSQSSFQPSINVVPSSVIGLPAMVANGRNESRHLPQSPAVVTQCPSELLHSVREMAGGQVRLASMHVGKARFGVAMVLGSGHFAAAFFDLGEQSCQAMARQALKDGEIHLVLSDAADMVLLVPKLTSGCLQAFSCAEGAAPASISDFTTGLQSMESALKRVTTWEEMGVDPSSLKTITLSVCVPGLDGAPELEIRLAEDAQHTVH